MLRTCIDCLHVSNKDALIENTLYYMNALNGARERESKKTTSSKWQKFRPMKTEMNRYTTRSVIKTMYYRYLGSKSSQFKSNDLYFV